ncbi:1-deoxy-D-xylulose-5-phosphate reductoisomerase [Oceanomicrobium pacificus]|uniref:1-deoxy-D-xylulose 5-phosphate reductoisomerase n=1 Tax=Oceanomicrobium pacificus TaxID=2692916 RepID=A0A6B0TX18_9RHOB|nr:1-deoxy-D-xylulose-5-phosphate reductoisomerase [Oceanomicrobium pacificus]MXU65832.1 1-deoxy-D-xylulose-5-phosphate reductoisomerase [Oceanomicrobium pacificus]
MRRISILGATGSIGRNAFDLLMRLPEAERPEVELVSGASNIPELACQAKALKARIAVTADAGQGAALAEALKGSGIEVAAGSDALTEAAARPTDWTLSAIVGAAGLAPTLAAAANTGTLALANKESLVCAGALLKQVCAASGCTLLPVDSEHSAIFQALRGERLSEVSRIILTASGGPFRTWSRAQMAKATLDEALCHPNWDMGQRITIDSATMFNKALEVIETHQLFGVSPEQVEVVVHPQSIIHSMVEYRDGAIMAQLGAPDMRGAIGFALNWPERIDLPVERLDFATLSRLDFEPEDPDRFPALRLARRAMARGGLHGAVLNAAKEVALDLFIAGEIDFLAMAAHVEGVMDALDTHREINLASYDLAAVQRADALARATEPLGETGAVPTVSEA